MIPNGQQLEYERLAGLVHDLRNYLQIATSAIDVISKHADVASSASLGSIVSQAADSLRRAGALARRSREPDLPIGEDIALGDCLTEMAPLLRYACGPLIRIKLLVGLVPSIRCARLGLQNALLNVALNAREAMPMGGTLSITAMLAEGPETPEIELVVADTGHGMPDVVLERAFEPHFSTKTDGTGHGMGLPGVRHFIEQMGGRVSITSTEHVGTVVTLRLPAA